MNSPTITALVAAYNSDKTLPATLASLAAQTVMPDEIVVVNDGSTDETLGVIERFAGDNPGLNVRWLTQPNAGPGMARNAGLKLASCEYVAFVDADDTWRPTKVARLKEALAVQAATLFTHDIATVTAGGVPVLQSSAGYPERQVLGHAEPVLGLLVWHWLTTSAVTVRRDAVLAAGGFNTQLRLGEDWDLWVRVLALPGATLGYVPTVLTNYTVNPAGLSAMGLGQRGEHALRQLEDLVTVHSRRLAQHFGLSRGRLWARA